MRRHLVATMVAAVAMLPLGTVPTAYAATGSPPVTNPDTVTVHAGEGRAVDVTANDKDPDGDQLQVCRLGDLPRALTGSQVENGTLFVVAGRRVRGTFTMTYYACDDSYLTAGALTVVVKAPAPTLDIVPVGSAPPGRLRIRNTYKHQTFHCRWQPAESEKIEGRAVVKPLSTTVITVHEADVVVTCDGPHSGYGFAFDVAGGRLVRVAPTS